MADPATIAIVGSKYLPWVALGLKTIGSFFGALGAKEPETHFFDPELKERYKELRGFRQGQKEIMRSSVAAVDKVVHSGRGGALHKGDPVKMQQIRDQQAPLSPEMLDRLGIKSGEGAFSTGLHRAAAANEANPDSGQML